MIAFCFWIVRDYVIGHKLIKIAHFVNFLVWISALNNQQKLILFHFMIHLLSI